MSSASYLLSRIPVIFTAVLLISCLVVTPETVYAALSVFTPSTADTYVYNGNPDVNYGTSNIMEVFTDSTRTVRSFVKFDLSSIPPGSTINAAYLLLYVNAYDGGPASRNYVANRLTKDWVETQATWNVYKTGSNWAAPGGDYTSEGAASTPGAFGGWVTWTVTDIVKAWIQGGQPNYGFLIKDSAEGTGDTWIWFSTREVTEEEQRPILKVDWTPPSRPVGGHVVAVNKLKILTPYLALAGLVAIVSAVVVAKRRRD